MSRRSGSQAPRLGDLVRRRSRTGAQARIPVPLRRREVLEDLAPEARNLAPDDMVVVPLPGPLDQRRAVVGEQERAAGKGSAARNCRGRRGRRRRASDSRPRPAPAGRRASSSSRRPAAAANHPFGALRHGGADWPRSSESASAVRMVAAPNEPPETPEMAKMRRAGAMRCPSRPAVRPARSSSSPIAVAAAKAARLAPPSAATMTAGGQPRASQLAAFQRRPPSPMSICRRLKSSATALGSVRTSLKWTFCAVTRRAATTDSASTGMQILWPSQAR